MEFKMSSFRERRSPFFHERSKGSQAVSAALGILTLEERLFLRTIESVASRDDLHNADRVPQIRW